MKIFRVFLFCSFMIVCEIMGMPHASSIDGADEDRTDEFVFSVIPLKIILEHQLQAVKASKRSNSLLIKPELEDKNFKSLPKTTVSSAANICTETELRKRASPEDISKIFSGDVKFEEDEMRLQKIYDSMKDCQFVKVRTPKFFGPLWHCLNRLFLFFVFG